MLCPRCRSFLEPPQFVCPCFESAAQEEQYKLSARRFLAGELPLLTVKGHAAKTQTHAWCGARINRKDGFLKRCEVGCKACMDEMQRVGCNS